MRASRRLPLLRTLAVCGVLGLGCNDYAIIKQPMREAFWQSPRDKVDLLFVIDDSPSMLEEAAPVDTTVVALLDALVGQDVDLRVRAVTTSSSLLLEWTPVDAPEQVPELALLLDVSPEGSTDEPGLQVAVDQSVGARSEAMLHTVVVSDEDDRSDDPVEDLVARLDARSEVGHRLHAVTGDLPAGCARDGMAADPAPRYRSAGEQTAGAALSICSATLTAELGALSFDLTGLRARFPLSSLPDPASLTVWVDGALVPRSQLHGWRWEPADNALVFDGFAIPPPSARIEVEYDVARKESSGGISTLPDDTAAPSAAP